jgi:hypothetical protein
VLNSEALGAEDATARVDSALEVCHQLLAEAGDGAPRTEWFNAAAQALTRLRAVPVVEDFESLAVWNEVSGVLDNVLRNLLRTPGSWQVFEAATSFVTDFAARLPLERAPLLLAELLWLKGRWQGRGEDVLEHHMEYGRIRVEDLGDPALGGALEEARRALETPLVLVRTDGFEKYRVALVHAFDAGWLWYFFLLPVRVLDVVGPGLGEVLERVEVGPWTPEVTRRAQTLGALLGTSTDGASLTDLWEATQEL